MKSELTMNGIEVEGSFVRKKKGKSWDWGEKIGDWNWGGGGIQSRAKKKNPPKPTRQ